jgi:hypothetical protein
MECPRICWRQMFGWVTCSKRCIKAYRRPWQVSGLGHRHLEVERDCEDLVDQFCSIGSIMMSAMQ